MNNINPVITNNTQHKKPKYFYVTWGYSFLFFLYNIQCVSPTCTNLLMMFTHHLISSRLMNEKGDSQFTTLILSVRKAYIIHITVLHVHLSLFDKDQRQFWISYPQTLLEIRWNFKKSQATYLMCFNWFNQPKCLDW